MKLLPDTHLLLWSAIEPKRLSRIAEQLLTDEGNELYFSVVSLWEVAIKRSLGRDDFDVDARVLRRSLVDNGYSELTVTADHAFMVEHLPWIHKDPFDRLLMAQATAEGITLLTADRLLGSYPGPVRTV